MANTRGSTGANGSGKNGANWAKLQDEYVTGDKTLNGLARDHEVPASTVRNRAAKGDWAGKRRHFRTKTAHDTHKKRSEAESDRRAKNQKALDLRMDGSALSLLRKSVNAETAAQSKDYAIAFGVVMDKRFQELRGIPAGTQTGTASAGDADDVAKFEAIFRATRVQVDRDDIDRRGDQ